MNGAPSLLFRPQRPRVLILASSRVSTRVYRADGDHGRPSFHPRVGLSQAPVALGESRTTEDLVVALGGSAEARCLAVRAPTGAGNRSKLGNDATASTTIRKLPPTSPNVKGTARQHVHVVDVQQPQRGVQHEHDEVEEEAVAHHEYRGFAGGGGGGMTGWTSDPCWERMLRTGVDFDALATLRVFRNLQVKSRFCAPNPPETPKNKMNAEKHRVSVEAQSPALQEMSRRVIYVQAVNLSMLKLWLNTSAEHAEMPGCLVVFGSAPSFLTPPPASRPATWIQPAESLYPQCDRPKSYASDEPYLFSPCERPFDGMLMVFHTIAPEVQIRSFFPLAPPPAPPSAANCPPTYRCPWANHLNIFYAQFWHRSPLTPHPIQSNAARDCIGSPMLKIEPMLHPRRRMAFNDLSAKYVQGRVSSIHTENVCLPMLSPSMPLKHHGPARRSTWLTPEELMRLTAAVINLHSTHRPVGRTHRESAHGEGAQDQEGGQGGGDDAEPRTQLGAFVFQVLNAVDHVSDVARASLPPLRLPRKSPASSPSWPTPTLSGADCASAALKHSYTAANDTQVCLIPAVKRIISPAPPLPPLLTCQTYTRFATNVKVNVAGQGEWAGPAINIARTGAFEFHRRIHIDANIDNDGAPPPHPLVLARLVTARRDAAPSSRCLLRNRLQAPNLAIKSKHLATSSAFYHLQAPSATLGYDLCSGLASLPPQYYGCALSARIVPWLFRPQAFCHPPPTRTHNASLLIMPPVWLPLARMAGHLPTSRNSTLTMGQTRSGPEFSAFSLPRLVAPLQAASFDFGPLLARAVAAEHDDQVDTTGVK
ncbi:hypothetical protein DFH09DRAFT_1081078 [Mycena vulgaris]|nr:hypothetical protein DFH09DRAFT_1081078 [Mycena vulgaris]